MLQRRNQTYTHEMFIVISVIEANKKLSCRKETVRLLHGSVLAKWLLRGLRPFKVTDVGTNRQPVCDILLVINTN